MSLLIGIGLVPVVGCAVVIIVIISCACCSMKKKNCKDIPKNGYAVTPGKIERGRERERKREGGRGGRTGEFKTHYYSYFSYYSCWKHTL